MDEEVEIPNTFVPAITDAPQETIEPLQELTPSPTSIFENQTFFSFEPIISTKEPTIKFSTYKVNEIYYNSDKTSYADLLLELPHIEGGYAGIDKINEYFVGKKAFFLNELDLECLEGTDQIHGVGSNFYRSAKYRLNIQIDNIVSIFGVLDGGEGGVSWIGLEGNIFDLNTGEKLSLSDLFNVSEDIYMEGRL